jgi:anthranilate phosphoribosyltransferase
MLPHARFPLGKKSKPTHDDHVLHDLTAALSNRSLTKEEIGHVTGDLLDASISGESKASFLSAWAQRGETAPELAACAEAFLPHAVDPGIRGTWKGRALLDCCGTGGGGLNLLNVSTGLMFILGAMSIPVVKHGNRGITKKSGSADVLEALGIKIDLAPEHVTRCLEEVGCAFLFAPAYHFTFSVIAPVRRSLGEKGRRTVFNLLGPLLNPARPQARLVGVFKPEHVVLYAKTLEQMKCPMFSIACGEDAPSGRMLGEVSAHGTTLLGGTLRHAKNEPFERLERKTSPPQKIETLFVQNAGESAKRLVAILSRKEQGLGRETLLINAAVAAWTHGTAASLEEGLTQSTEALDSGRALERLKRWQEFSR